MRRAVAVRVRSSASLHSSSCRARRCRDSSAASFAFQAAIRAWPADGYAYAWAGRSLIRLGRHAEARPYLEKAQALLPNDPQIQEDLDELRRRGA